MLILTTTHIKSLQYNAHPLPQKPDKVTQLGKWDPQKGRHQFQGRLPLQLLGNPQEDQAARLLHVGSLLFGW